MNEKESCQCIGAADFSLSECVLCRDQAHPLYKQCITVRITKHLKKASFQNTFSEISQKIELTPEYS